jgi:signal transduction histidine kinase
VLGLKSQTLNLHAPADETWIKGDRARISQVITNLLSNASKYSPNDTVIELRCETDGDRLQIAVTDQGIGMSEEEQEKLFTAFFRVDNETTRKVAGTGLGLLIAKSITELHDGNINLNSQPGKGTTIKISLPGIVSKEAAEAVEQVGFTGSRLWPKNDTDELDLGAD